MAQIIPLVFVSPPAGKPDPRLPPPAQGGNDTRTRVRQEASKQQQCWYYAFNFVRVRHGKSPTAQAAPERQFEAAVSAFRKKASAHQQKLPEMSYQLGAAAGEALKTMTLASVRRQVQLGPLLGTLVGEVDAAAMRAFCAQTVYTNYYDYLLDQKYGERSRLQHTLLAQQGVDPARSYPSSSHAQARADSVPFARLEVASKAAYMGALINLICAERYGLRPVPWAIGDSPQSLARLLRERGPLVAMGGLGTCTYSQPPIALSETVAGGTVYGWRPGAALPANAITGHTVLLVGCEQRPGAKARIYYIDPDDASAPESPRRVYTLAYDLFVNKITDRMGVGGAPSSDVGYLLAGPSWQPPA